MNTDGLAKGKPGLAACDAVVSGFNGAFWDCFAQPLAIKCLSMQRYTLF